VSDTGGRLVCPQLAEDSNAVLALYGETGRGAMKLEALCATLQNFHQQVGS
jgi:hypothetical protein